MSKEEFSRYVEENENYLGEVGKILAEGLGHDDVGFLKDHMSIILAHRATLVTMLAKLVRDASIAKEQYWPAKSKDLTDKDRSIIIDAKMAEHEYWIDIVDGFISTIDKQASATQTQLSFEKKALTQLQEM